jgi:hypothetical protein
MKNPVTASMAGTCILGTAVLCPDNASAPQLQPTHQTQYIAIAVCFAYAPCRKLRHVLCATDAPWCGTDLCGYTALAYCGLRSCYNRTLQSSARKVYCKNTSSSSRPRQVVAPRVFCAAAPYWRHCFLQLQSTRLSHTCLYTSTRLRLEAGVLHYSTTQQGIAHT